jgi:hypothetical protein
MDENVSAGGKKEKTSRETNYPPVVHRRSTAGNVKMVDMAKIAVEIPAFWLFLCGKIPLSKAASPLPWLLSMGAPVRKSFWTVVFPV